jgi:phospho-N-acetylmuramoyl-pentapeptide-transferase
MLSYLAGFEDIFGPFRLFQFITFRAMMAGVTALLVGYWIAPWIIRKLANFKQAVRTKEEVGADLAKKHEGKSNTPTMGGVIILVALLVSTFLWVKPFQEVDFVETACEDCGATFSLSRLNNTCTECGAVAQFDSDRDGLADSWEQAYHGSLDHDADDYLADEGTCMDAYVATRMTDLRLNSYVLTALVVYIGLSLVGFLDDYLKVSKKNSKGLAGRYKMLGQSIVTVIALGILMNAELSSENMREVWVPFYRHVLIDGTPIWAVGILLFFVLVGSSNAINLTDGLDGLATGCTVTVALAYGVMAYIVGNFVLSDTLLIEQVLGVGELSVVCTALLGACLAFLWYNSAPAEVFMGDTGSLALGGLVGAIAFMVQQPFTLVIVGGIFVMEALSVILQVGNYKLNGKRILRMAPIHHHFELSGWAETKVVIRFWILSLIFALAGLATLKIR